MFCFVKSSMPYVTRQSTLNRPLALEVQLACDVAVLWDALHNEGWRITTENMCLNGLPATPHANCRQITCDPPHWKREREREGAEKGRKTETKLYKEYIYIYIYICRERSREIALFWMASISNSMFLYFRIGSCNEGLLKSPFDFWQ